MVPDCIIEIRQDDKKIMENILANFGSSTNKILLTLVSTLKPFFSQWDWGRAVTVFLDIVLVALLFYALYLLVKGTRGIQILWGFVILVVFMLLGKIFNLATFNWLLSRLLTMLVVAIPIVFQPELRRVLERLGRRGFLASKEFSYRQVINPVAETVDILRRQKIGALIVLEKKVGLGEYVETGTSLDAKVSTELILNIFTKAAPLHDGAIILQGDRLVAAGCMLPLSERKEFLYFGTRHRAALGLSEISDAVIIVVSEEKGITTIIHNEKIYRDIKGKVLKEKLISLLKKNG